MLVKGSLLEVRLPLISMLMDMPKICNPRGSNCANRSFKRVHIQGVHRLWKTGKTGKMMKKNPCRENQGI